MREIRTPSSFAGHKCHGMKAMNSSSAIIARMSALGRDEMQALQLTKLRRQLERLEAASGFYRERWEKAGIRVKREKISDL